MPPFKVSLACLNVSGECRDPVVITPRKIALILDGSGKNDLFRSLKALSVHKACKRMDFFHPVNQMRNNWLVTPT